MDIKTAEARSRNMSAIKDRDTKPELFLRRLLHANGYRYRLYRKNIPGKPDLYLAKYNTVIFVHGCFWHQHRGCKYAYMPKSNSSFWHEKLSKNIERDKKNALLLTELGFRTIIIWECTIRQIKQEVDKAYLLNKIQSILHSNSLGPYEL